MESKRHQASDIRCQTSNVRHQTWDIRPLTSDLRHHMSDVWHQTDTRHITSDVCHETCDIRHKTSDLRHETWDVWHQISISRHQTYTDNCYLNMCSGTRMNKWLNKCSETLRFLFENGLKDHHHLAWRVASTVSRDFLGTLRCAVHHK